jgi:hypothetical protein
MAPAEAAAAGHWPVEKTMSSSNMEDEDLPSSTPGTAPPNGAAPDDVESSQEFQENSWYTVKLALQDLLKKGGRLGKMSPDEKARRALAKHFPSLPTRLWYDMYDTPAFRKMSWEVRTKVTGFGHSRKHYKRNMPDFWWDALLRDAMAEDTRLNLRPILQPTMADEPIDHSLMQATRYVVKDSEAMKLVDPLIHYLNTVQVINETEWIGVVKLPGRWLQFPSAAYNQVTMAIMSVCARLKLQWRWPQVAETARPFWDIVLTKHFEDLTKAGMSREGFVHSYHGLITLFVNTSDIAQLELEGADIHRRSKDEFPAAAPLKRLTERWMIGRALWGWMSQADKVRKHLMELDQYLKDIDLRHPQVGALRHVIKKIFQGRVLKDL